MNEQLTFSSAHCRQRPMKHGGDLSEAIAHHGGSVDDWLDLSTGLNPWPWPVSFDLGAACRRLPSYADMDALQAAARTAYRVDRDVMVVAAAGSQALIQCLPRLAAPGPVAIADPAYEEHATAWAAAGHPVVRVNDSARRIAGVRHAVIVNPNNPDGRVTDRATLVAAATQAAGRGGWLVVDESFADVDPALDAGALCAMAPVIVLRSFGKFHGLAGLRLGFAFAPPPIGRRVAEALGPWPVSGPAIAVGCAALADAAWRTDMRRRLAQQAGRLDRVLAAARLVVVGGTSLFRLVRHPDAGTLHDALARRRIWTRIFDRHPGLLRVGLPGDQIGLDRLAVALADLHG